MPIGEHDEEKAEYLQIKKSYTEDCEGEDNFFSMISKKATLRLKTMRDKVHAELNNARGH